MDKVSILLKLSSIPLSFWSLKVLTTIALQNKFIYCGYFPLDSRTRVDVPPFVHRKTIKSLDGIKLDAWLMPHIKSPKEKPTVLYFQGNAGNLGHRRIYFEELINRACVNIITFHYRGYGYSSGRSTEKGIKMDAQRLLEFAIKEVDWVSKSNLFALGHSLGMVIA